MCPGERRAAELRREMSNGKENYMTAQHGDTVRVLYWGDVAGGTVFGTKGRSEPLEFNIGKGQVIAGLEEAVVGMKIGEEKTVEIPMEKAFGRRDKRNIVVVNRGRLPKGLVLEVGKHVCLKTGDGRRAVFAVAHVLESSVALNANHPLSGRDITLRIRLLKIARERRPLKRSICNPSALKRPITATKGER
jgi:peptidylprolyl isomerase